LDPGSLDLRTSRPIGTPFWTHSGPIRDPYLGLSTILAIPEYPGLGFNGVARPHTIYMAFGQLQILGPARDPPGGPQIGPRLDPFAPSLPGNDPFWTHFGPHFGPLLGPHFGQLELDANTVESPTSRLTPFRQCQPCLAPRAPGPGLWAICALLHIWGHSGVGTPREQFGCFR